MSMLERRQDEEDCALEEAVDNLHLATLDLLVPGHGKTPPERARDRERMAPLLERSRRRGRGVGSYATLLRDN